MSDTPNPPDTPRRRRTPPTTTAVRDPRARRPDPLLEQPIALQDEMERSFLDYAMSVIMSRALARRARRPQAGAPPDHLGHGRAGLPPRPPVREVGPRQRRHDGEVPPARRQRDLRRARAHGAAVLAAPPAHRLPRQLRLARLRSAASRYTECRLHPLAMQLLADIDENTVDMVPTYDASREEPTVLPARFPNLLVNGSQGIAVGMATNIPPHNLGEVIDATVHLIDHPDATPDDLMQFVKGPDFPTGGSILGRAGIMDAYRTGRGSVKMRATATIEETRAGLPDRGHRAAVPDELLVDRRPHPGARRCRRARRHQRRQRRLGRRQDRAGRHAQARRQPQRGAQQPVQAHLSCRPASA
jgi:DNA gyrase subunit A